MSTMIKFAPYAYLAKRSGNNTLYDLLLIVPVDTTGDTDLSNVTPVKSGGTRITIDYTTTGTGTNVLYRFKHLTIDSDGTYLDLEIQGDNNADRTTLVTFADADTEPATVTNQYQTCAPYLFVKKETVSSSQKFTHPSCIILFDAGLGAQSESLIFDVNGCLLTFTLGNNGVTTDPSKFAINQNIKAAIVSNGTHIFEAIVAGNNYLAKPPRKSKLKMYW